MVSLSVALLSNLGIDKNSRVGLALRPGPGTTFTQAFATCNACNVPLSCKPLFHSALSYSQSCAICLTDFLLDVLKQVINLGCNFDYITFFTIFKCAQ